MFPTSLSRLHSFPFPHLGNLPYLVVSESWQLPTIEPISHSPNPFCIVNGCGKGPIWMGSQFSEMFATRSIIKHDMLQGTQWQELLPKTEVGYRCNWLSSDSTGKVATKPSRPGNNWTIKGSSGVGFFRVSWSPERYELNRKGFFCTS